MDEQYGIIYIYIHSHPHLLPKYPSLQDELLLNRLHPIGQSIFCNFLIKAIKCHKIAITTYRSELNSKYYKKEYGILRNDPIGLPHILALILYTDDTKLCREFRSTYRRINNETTTKEVEDRHKELYHFGRYLFEAIEFYGVAMNSTETVYHGLNKYLHFSNFTTYFNQPISTTTSEMVAREFSQFDGSGIVLTFRAATDYKNNRNRMPKYLAVKWLSAHPNEDEKLFYGNYIKFRIQRIMDGHSPSQKIDNAALEAP